MKTLTKSVVYLLSTALFLAIAQLATAKPRPAGPPYPEKNLNAWRFDNTNLLTGAGTTYLAQQNARLAESWSGYALNMNGKSTELFLAPMVGSNGRTNLSAKCGSIRMWFRPDWTSGSLGGKGPGSAGRLFEMGAWSDKTAVGWWSLQFNSSGNTLSLVAQSGNDRLELLKTSIRWQSGQWHQVTLSYSARGSWLFVDGHLVDHDDAVALLPLASYRGTLGFSLGSDVRGSNLAQGQIDEVTTFGQVQTADSILYNYNAYADTAALGPITADEEAARAQWLASLRAARTSGTLSATTLSANSSPALMSAMLSVPTPGGGGGSGGGTNSTPPYTPAYSMPGLKLMVLGASGSNVTLRVADGTNGVVYDLYRATNLVGTTLTNAAWTWLGLVTNNQTIVLPGQPGPNAFYVLGTPQDSDADGLTDAFESLITHTAKNSWDSDGDGMSDGWEWENFGNFTQTGTQDFDQDGYNNLYEFLAGTDPNTAMFVIQLANDHVRSTNVTGTTDLLRGFPTRMAVLVNNTNFSSAVWVPYFASFTATLGPADGKYDVWVGLRGRADDSVPVWMRAAVTLDRTPPLVVITNPVASLTSKPVIQVQGYSPEPLAGVSFSVSNALGAGATAAGFVTSQYFDAATRQLTTNFFQCFDVELTNGQNIITVRVADLAGNTTTNRLTCALDYTGDSNAPVVTVTWPQNGAKIGLASVTLRGRVDDETATVVVKAVAGLTTNSMSALVERNGAFWVEDLSLVAGTNTLTITATDAAGNTRATNLTLIGSDMQLSINAVSDALLNQNTVTVSGLSSTTNAKVWVNGVAATMSGTGAWTASNVRVPSGGTAVFAVTAIPLSDNGGNGTPPTVQGTDPASWNPTSASATSAADQRDKPAQVKLIRGDWSRYDLVTGPGALFHSRSYGWRWNESEGGFAEKVTGEPQQDGQEHWSGLRYRVDTNGTEHFELWSESPTNVYSTTPVPLEEWFWPGFSVQGPSARGQLEYALPDDNSYYAESAETKTVLRTGGKALVSRLNIVAVSGAASENLPTQGRAIPPVSLLVPGLGLALGADGKAYGALPDNAEVDVTLQAPARSYNYTVSATKHRLKIVANSGSLAPERVVPAAEFCVGQWVGFYTAFVPDLPNIQSRTVQWALDGGFVNESWQNYSATIQPVPYGSVNYRVNPLLLQQPTTGAWWITGGLPPVTYAAKMAELLTMSNGQQVAAKARGLFHMSRPGAIMVNPIVHGAPALRWKAFWDQNLYYGTVQVGTNGGTNDLCYDLRVVSPKFGGTAKLIQLCSLNNSGVGNYCTNALDSTAACPSASVVAGSTPTGTTNLMRFESSPEASGFFEIKMDAAYKDYVMFSPGGASDIFVSLGKVNWSAWANAIYNLTNRPGAVTGPLGPDGSGDFPEWIDVH